MTNQYDQQLTPKICFTRTKIYFSIQHVKTEVSLSLEAPGEGEGEKQPVRKKLSTESTNVWYKKTQNNQNEITIVLILLSFSTTV